VNYKVYLKDLNAGMSNLADRFQRKERIIKEKSSIGGFRIPQESLKKRVNYTKATYDYHNQHEHGDFNPNANPAFNSFSFNPNEKPLNNIRNNYKIELSESLVDESLPYDPNKELAGNLIDRLDLEINKLKKESEEYIKYKESNVENKLKQRLPDLDESLENKVINQYLHYDPSRIQTFKHVTTQLKPEYISLEDLQKMKEEHQKKMLEIENQYYSRKRKEQDDLEKFLKYSDNNLAYYSEMQAKVNESKKITPEEIASILKHEEDYLNDNKKRRINIRNRARSARVIKRIGVSEYPMTKEEERYVKKYMNYKLQKQIKDGKDEKGMNNTAEGWNTTKIKSQNVNGVVNRGDGLPGYIDTDDHSHYYVSIGSNTPRSLSIKSVAVSRSKSFKSRKSKRTRSKSVNTRKAVISKKSQAEEDNQKMNSHLAFIKLIYNLLDKERTGSIKKEIISKETNIDEKIILNLGFNTKEDFIDSLLRFPTAEENHMNEQELIAFFLSRSDIGELFLENFRNNREETNLRAENNYEFNNYNYEIFQDLEKEPELDSHKMDFLNYESTEERLDKLKESLNKNYKIKEYNKNLTTKLKRKIDSNNKNSKVNISYKDYTSFLRKYKSTAELNFTVPKPFEFFKRDYLSNKLHRIQEILEERKQKEDEILGYRFKPNQLKREIFISQYANVIEAERERRKYRTEKLKEKIIQEMKPFSFYEHDERRHKEKLARESEPPQFAPFKANVIPWTSQVNLYDDILKKTEDQRRARIEERKMSLYQTAKLPPRMEMHEKRKMQQENEMKLIEKNLSKIQRSKSFRANKVPNFTKAHDIFNRTLEQKKSTAKLTKIQPFNLNEPKVKIIHNFILYKFLEKSNFA